MQSRGVGGKAIMASGTRRGAGRAAAAIVVCAAFIACGGSSGKNQPSMSVSTNQITVSATLADPAPTATVEIVITNPPSSGLYVGANYTTNGIDTAALSGTSGNTAAVLVSFKFPAVLGVGKYDDTLMLAVCNDSQCTSQIANSPQTVSVTYTVTSAPLSLGSISPSTVVAGGSGFSLTANGSGFTAASTVQWNGSNRPTTYLSPTQLTAQIAAADVGTPGTVTVTVSDPGAGVSNGVAFTIQTPAPLALTAIYPSSVVAGGPDFVLTVAGTGFGVSSSVTWTGAPLPTSYVSPTELTANVSAADIASPGTVSIAVQNPGSTSNALTLTIGAPSKDAVSFLITPSHTGVVNFNSVSFPAASTWSVNLGGAPSYAIIAAGKVFVTVGVSGNSQLVALDQATGATAWGPISIAGPANAAYDGGIVFVLSSTSGGPGLLQAFDAASGALKWSVLLTGQYSFSSAPTAANGLVFTGGAGVGGTLYAVNAANGAIAWTQPVANGDSSTPAVTADGVYVTYPCETYDFRPETGALLWNNYTGCSGGGGATPVVANSVIYAPNGFGSYSGMTFNAETGTLLGSYAADNPPAIGPQIGYFLQSGTLRGITLDNSTILWSFAGDGMLVTSPIGVNQYVIVGSSSGRLYALDGTTGAQVWTVNLGAALPAGAGWGSRMPFSGLAAGDGLLVVPAGNTLTAFTLSTSP